MVRVFGYGWSLTFRGAGPRGSWPHSYSRESQATPTVAVLTCFLPQGCHPSSLRTMSRRATPQRSHTLRPSVGGTGGFFDDADAPADGAPQESREDHLQRRLFEKDKEIEKMRTQIQTLRAQLATRPSAEKFQEQEKEIKTQETLIRGGQALNKQLMEDINAVKEREKLLEDQLRKLAGENWATNLEIPASSSPLKRPAARRSVDSGSGASKPPSGLSPNATTSYTTEETIAYLETVKQLVMGMESRLSEREDKLAQFVSRAEKEGRKFEEISKQLNASANT